MNSLYVSKHIELMNGIIYISFREYDHFTRKDHAIVAITMQPFFYGCGA